MDTLPRDFKYFLRLLNVHDARYLVVGGYAVAFHGYARHTGDIDVWIEAETRNAERVVRALKDFGFRDAELDPTLFATPDHVVRFGVEPMRIEILTGLSGVEFAPCFTNRVTRRIDDLDVPFLSLADLRDNKRAAGRTKDRLDLENLPEET